MIIGVHGVFWSQTFDIIFDDTISHDITAIVSRFAHFYPHSWYSAPVLFKHLTNDSLSSSVRYDTNLTFEQHQIAISPLPPATVRYYYPWDAIFNSPVVNLLLLHPEKSYLAVKNCQSSEGKKHGKRTASRSKKRIQKDKKKKSREDANSAAERHDAIYVYLANDGNRNMCSRSCCYLWYRHAYRRRRFQYSAISRCKWKKKKKKKTRKKDRHKTKTQAIS